MDVLLISGAFPYPPQSGYETRVYQLARQLARRHTVTLLSYIQPGREEHVRRLREELPVEVVDQRPLSHAAKRVLQLSSAALRRPYLPWAIHAPRMQDAVERLCARRRFDVVQLESSLLGEFRVPAGALVVLDEHNIEYELVERLGRGERSLPRRSFHRLEYAHFRRFEERFWQHVSGCAVTSDRETAIVHAHAPKTPVAVVPNGVDVSEFRPWEGPSEPRTIVFNGVLDYRPNLDAALFLVDEIWPLVLRRHPDARVTIVGRGAAADLRRLRKSGASVTGQVPDVRPHLERASVVAVPIRMGGGTRLKVVEALALAKGVVSTTLGAEGIDVRDGEHLLTADSAEAFAEAVCRLFDEPDAASALGKSGRRLVEQSYSWNRAGECLEALYERLANTESGDSVTRRPSSRDRP